MATPGLGSLEKSLSFLGRVVADAGARPLPALAAEAGLPLSTAHRVALALQQAGFLIRVRRGVYLPGPVLLRLGRAADFHAVLARVARPILRQLARSTGRTAHLGVFEDDMVTYLVKEGRAGIISREGMQLEGYCSGIGKVLLAALPEGEQERYLAGGPFVKLTPNTIVEPDLLREEFCAVAAQGYAVDDGEIDAGLRCLAVPVRGDDGVCAAISVSGVKGTELLPALVEAALLLQAKLSRAALKGSGAVRPQPPEALKLPSESHSE